MKYYKHLTTNAVHAFEADGSQDSFIGSYLIAITEAEANVLRNPPKSAAELAKEASSLAIAQIAKLRDEVTPDVLSFLAALAGCPQSIKNAAALTAVEKAKIKA